MSVHLGRNMRVAVIGSGLSGLTAAAPLAKRGHEVTVYTIAPHAPANGRWEERREEWADKLLGYAEKYVPGLRQHAVTQVICTPEDFSHRTHLADHAFGGCPPRIDRTPPRHRTPIRGLWFVGAQSEAFGGVTGAMTSAQNAVGMMLGRGRAT